MKASLTAKSVLASLLDLSGISLRSMRRNSRGRVAILMYHRILPRERMSDSVQAGMVVEPDTFRLHVRHLKQRFRIVSLDDFVAVPDVVFADSRNHPVCILTFDDGWLDFYEYAYPVLRAENVPATVFLPTSYIGTDRWFWTDRLGFVLDQARIKLVPTGIGNRPHERFIAEILALQGTAEARLERAIGLLKPLRMDEIVPMLDRLSYLLEVPPTPPGRAFLNWSEVREMFESRLVGFGSHTAEHPILTTLTDPEVRRELAESRDALVGRGLARPETLAFCYPNGGTSQRIERLVAEAGYGIAVTTRRGWNGIETGLHALARIGMHQDICATKAMLAARLAGFI